MKNRIIILSMIMVFIYAYAFAAISVVSIKGEAAYKDKQQWKPMKVGQRLSEGMKVSTGVNSMITLNIDNSIIKIKQLSMVRINKNIILGDTSHTNLGLKYGSINTQIQKIEKLKTVFKISTPVATSSVRGSGGETSNWPVGGMTHVTFHGVFDITNKNGINNTVVNKMLFELKSGDARSSNLLTPSMNISSTKIYPANITETEKGTNEIHGDDIINNSEGLPSSVVQAKETTARGSVKLNWN